MEENEVFGAMFWKGILGLHPLSVSLWLCSTHEVNKLPATHFHHDALCTTGTKQQS